MLLPAVALILAAAPLQAAPAARAALLPAGGGDSPSGAWAADHLEELTSFYRELHAHPELSFHETETARRMAAVLNECGFEVTEQVGGTGVVGVLRNGTGPTVLVRTDMDALPILEATGLPFASQVKARDDAGREVGVMHACGHDVHMTVWSGTARFLAANQDRWHGTVVFIAQPAEERGAGATAMIGDGLFTRFPQPDYTLALHVDGDYAAGQIAFTPEWCYANVDSVDIVVKGKGGHGSKPHTTNDPVALAARIVMGLQTIVSREVRPIDPAVVTVGSIHGGTKHNIIPDQVKMELTVRTYAGAVREQVLAAIKRVAREEARAAGFPDSLLPEVTVLENEHTPASYNDPELVARINKVFVREIGEENLLPKEPSMGGEDFGLYARTLGVPGYMFSLGSIPRATWEAAQKPGAPPLPSLHTNHYAPLPEATIRTGVTVMGAALLDLLQPAG